MTIRRILGFLGMLLFIASMLMSAEIGSLLQSVNLGIIDMGVITASCVSVASIDEFCGPNPGGQNKLFVINKRDLLLIPAPAVGSHEITTPITVKPGKGFVEWDFTLDTGELTSESVGDQGNQSCKVGVGVYIPRSNKLIDKVINDSYNGQYVVIVQDALGQKKIGGSVDRGLMFTTKYTSGKKFDDKNGREVGFTGGQPVEPYFYTGEIPMLAAVV